MTADMMIEESVTPAIWLQPNHRNTFLVVEDDRLVREATCELLRQSGYDVIEADSVATANELFALRSGEIDLLLCDTVCQVETELMFGAACAKQFQGSKPF